MTTLKNELQCVRWSVAVAHGTGEDAATIMTRAKELHQIIGQWQAQRLEEINKKQEEEMRLYAEAVKKHGVDRVMYSPDPKPNQFWSITLKS